MTKKIGLVIQGPLTSIGRTGANLHASPEQLKKDGGIVHFDCRGNIQRVIEEFGHFFDEIVVSTWDNEVKAGESFLGAKLVSAPDPGGIAQPGHYKDNNKYRQFISVLNGLNELEKSGVEYVVKIRTDQYMNINGLLSSFFTSLETNQDRRAIYATVVCRPTFLLHDLYFASTLSSMKEFCQDILAYDCFEFISSVHREMVLKHAYLHYREFINVPDWAYFPISPPNGVNPATRKIFDYMFSKVFFSIDPDVFRSTLWRGEYYEVEHISALVEINRKSRKYNIPALISTDWRRYFYFRKKFFGHSMSVIDWCVMQIGSVGWNFWSIIRRVATRPIIKKFL